MTSIAISGLTKRFRKTTAVDSLNVDVSVGRVTGLVGPNGAGKTTTLRCLLGLVRPSSGSATVNGKHYEELDDPLRLVGAVVEGAGFYPGRTGRDHVRMLTRTARLPDERADEVLDLVGLTDDAHRRVKAYSMGMRQRLALASALVGDPEILVLDEPANGLDPAGIRWVRDFIRAHAEKGGTVLVSSHDLSELSLTAHDVVILNRGKLIKAGPMAELTVAPVPKVRVRTSEVERLVTLLDARGVKHETPAEGAVVIEASPEEIGELVAEHSIPLQELVLETTTLEDVFLEMTRGSEEVEE